MNIAVADNGRRYVDRLRRRRQRKKTLLKKCINAIVLYLINKISYRKLPVPETNSIRQGHHLCQEIMDGNINRFKHSTRCPTKETFRELINLLSSPQGGLATAARNSLILPEQKVMVLICALLGHSTREMKEHWQLSTSTISLTIDEVIDSIKNVQHLEVRLETEDTPTHSKLDDEKFRWFRTDANTCIGAMDGSYISACVNDSLASRFRNRKGFLSFNMLGVCDFDGLFTYILNGWEGSAGDGRVYRDGLQKGLVTLLRKFRLADAAYKLSLYCLTPYVGVRYHLKEWGTVQEKPRNREELFNLRHAQLRNIIERAFGILKTMFPLLSMGKMRNYPLKKQIDLINCAIFLYNFIRRRNLYEDEIDNNNDDDADNGHDDNAYHANDADYAEAVAWRDEIAENMWQDYVAVLVQRGERGIVQV